MYRSKLKEWRSAFIEAFIIAGAMYFLFWPFLIEGSSMENTFKTGDRVLVSRICACFGFIDYNDIVLCEINTDEGEEIIVKRVIGKPNDHIVIKDGKVILNDSIISEPYIKSEGHTEGDINIILKSDEYYVMGDNREKSTDSRFFGPIKKSDIKSKVLIRWYPFDKIGTVE